MAVGYRNYFFTLSKHDTKACVILYSAVFAKICLVVSVHLVAIVHLLKSKRER